LHRGARRAPVQNHSVQGRRHAPTRASDDALGMSLNSGATAMHVSDTMP